MKQTILLLAFALAVGCTSKKVHRTGAHNALDAYIQAIREDKPRAAYDLLDESVKTRVPYPWFKGQWKTNRKELLAQAKELASKKLQVTLRYQTKTGERITMVTEDGQWKVDGAPGLYPTPSSPEQLLQLMARAIDTMDFALYISLLSPEYRRTVLKALRLKMEQLKKARLKLPKNKSDDLDQVTVSLDTYGNFKLVLKRVGKTWMIHSWEVSGRRRR